MDIGDKIRLCTCLLDGVEHVATVNQDGDTCLYCGHYVIKRVAKEKDVNRHNRVKGKIKEAKWKYLINVLKQQQFEKDGVE